ncbi:signal transducer and activator of transcription 5A-like [Actinia tenebrosa]|uniref:Signal transducer and activator of transcription n=1 Tax=Actinia tenebrosa TaxID=6105 RepID=A0A6P8H835_ACTTE|nr:signal transducer and activator of transcription 5A-like [Actinia tenebrosa]
MSLSQKLSTLDEVKKKEIKAQLQKHLPHYSVEAQVLLHPSVLEWMESQSWESSDASVAVNSITTMLQEKNVYMSNEPIELLNLLKIYYFVKDLVNQVVVDSELQKNDEQIREIQQKLKEREEFFLSQTICNLEIEKLKITNNNSMLTLQQDKSPKISEISNTIITLLQPLFDNISKVITKNKDLQSHILSQIAEWNFNKQQAQVGWPVFSFSEFLQPLILLCNRFARILWSTRNQTEKLLDILTKFRVNEESLIQAETMKRESRSMLSAFLKRCFVVEKQPPPTQLIDKGFSVSLRLLLGSQILSSSHASTVTCSLHLDDDIRHFYRAKFENVKAQDENIKNVQNNKKCLTYDKQTESFCVSFDKLKLHKQEKRKAKLNEDKTRLVTDQKSGLMFQTQIMIGTESFTIETFSVPIVVMTNTSQCLESEATIFWDNAFGRKDREPFTSPESIPLGDFLDALNKRWTKSNEGELQDYHLNYLAKKLFPDLTDMRDSHKFYVTKRMFKREHMGGPCKFTFTFWSWFYKIMKLVKEFLIDEWREKKIYGFIDKREAESKLNECLVGTFLLRFSDSIPGGITIAFKENMEGCNHVQPWTKDELKQKSFSDSMRDLQYDSELKCLQYLYPSTPIDQAFPQKDHLNNNEQFNPRYPKKAPIRVVRHDDGGSTSASNFSSNRSSSFQITSPPPSVGRNPESSNGNEQAFSPMSFDHDPLLSQPMFFNDQELTLNLPDQIMDGEGEDLCTEPLETFFWGTKQ